MVAPYQVFPTRDGELMVAGGNDRLFALLCDVVEMPELVSDSRFRTNPDRVQNREALVALLSDRLRDRDTAEWQALLTAAGVPAAPVADVADVVGSPTDRGPRDAAARRASADSRASPSGAPAVVRRCAGSAPLAPSFVGEHTAEVLAEAGYSEDEIAELARDGTVRLG